MSGSGTNGNPSEGQKNSGQKLKTVVEVGNPLDHIGEKVKDTFTSYEIIVRTNDPSFNLKFSCVRRRYKEFDWLYRHLRKSHVLRKPPAIPSKTYFTSPMDKMTVFKRCIGFEEFLKMCVRVPEYRSDTGFHLFLQTMLPIQEIEDILAGKTEFSIWHYLQNEIDSYAFHKDNVVRPASSTNPNRDDSASTSLDKTVVDIPYVPKYLKMSDSSMNRHLEDPVAKLVQDRQRENEARCSYCHRRPSTSNTTECIGAICSASRGHMGLPAVDIGQGSPAGQAARFFIGSLTGSSVGPSPAAISADISVGVEGDDVEESLSTQGGMDTPEEAEQSIAGIPSLPVSCLRVRHSLPLNVVVSSLVSPAPDLATVLSPACHHRLSSSMDTRPKRVQFTLPEKDTVCSEGQVNGNGSSSNVNRAERRNKKHSRLVLPTMHGKRLHKKHSTHRGTAQHCHTVVLEVAERPQGNDVDQHQGVCERGVNEAEGADLEEDMVCEGSDNSSDSHSTGGDRSDQSSTDGEDTGTDEECIGTGDECRVTDKECRGTGEECRVTDEECRVTEEEGRVTDEACTVTEEQCRLTNEQCRGTSEECNVQGESTSIVVRYTLEEDCNGIEERRSIEENCQVHMDELNVSDAGDYKSDPDISTITGISGENCDPDE